MEDFVMTKIAPDGEWANLNLSEMARLLQAANPGAKIISTGKEADQQTGVNKATADRNMIKGKP